jgi:hypothetical protein
MAADNAANGNIFPLLDEWQKSVGGLRLSANHATESFANSTIPEPLE